MEIRRQFTIARSWIPVMVASMVIAAGIAYVITAGQPKVYEARATIVVGQSLTGINPDYNQLLASQRLSGTYATVATTLPILTKVIDRLDLDMTPSQLRAQIAVATSQDTALLSITAQAGRAETAAAIANAIAAELIAASPAVEGLQADILESVKSDIQEIRSDIAVTQVKIDELLALSERTPEEDALVETHEGRIVSLRSALATLLAFTSDNGANVLAILEPAVVPDAPVGPRPLQNALLAAMVALIFVTAIAFIAEYLDDAPRDSTDIDDILGLPTLGTIERMQGGRKRAGMYRLATLLYPRSRVAESYRILRTNLEFASIDQPTRTILVTSAMPSEGKTVTASNLAVAMAQAGKRVLLVDADVRKPGIHHLFNLPNTRGLTDLLRSPVMSHASLVQQTEADGLEVLPAGPIPPNPAEILGSQRMRALVATLTGSYDLVIFDSPPLEVVTDAAVLSSYLNGTILVVEARRGRRSHLRNAREALTKANANVMGVVLNGLKPSARGDYGGYYVAAEDDAPENQDPSQGLAVGSMVVPKDAPTKTIKSS